jgi:DNA recombination-dependent growth factor C
VPATNVAIDNLHLLGLEEPADDDAEEPLARLDAEHALIAGTLRQLVASLRRELGG